MSVPEEGLRDLGITRLPPQQVHSRVKPHPAHLRVILDRLAQCRARGLHLAERGVHDRELVGSCIAIGPSTLE